MSGYDDLIKSIKHDIELAENRINESSARIKQETEAIDKCKVVIDELNKALKKLS